MYMAAIKAGFSKSDQEIARYAKALSAPAKIAILRMLSERDSCICGEIVEITPLAQSTVSQHLQELKELGLIRGTIDGVTSCYCINPAGFTRFKKLFQRFLSEIDVSSKCCIKK